MAGGAAPGSAFSANPVSGSGVARSADPAPTRPAGAAPGSVNPVSGSGANPVSGSGAKQRQPGQRMRRNQAT